MMRDDYYHSMPPSWTLRGRLTIAVILLIFVAVLAGTAWYVTKRTGVIDKVQSLATDGPEGNGAAPSLDPASMAKTAAQSGPALPPPMQNPVGAATPPLAMDSRMLDLEQRVMRVSAAAQSASSFANRAEAIMVAFAARRKLDAGAPLDYIAAQLQLLFGNAQPKAVATIINAASDPVTVNKLRAGLDDINQLIKQGNSQRSWWSSAMTTLGDLATLRSGDAPMIEPEQRLERARRAVDAGQIDDAIADVTALPKQPVISQWLEQARRYNEAHRALDVIEAAAILEPRNTPLVAPVAQAPAKAPK